MSQEPEINGAGLFIGIFLGIPFLIFVIVASFSLFFAAVDWGGEFVKWSNRKAETFFSDGGCK